MVRMVIRYEDGTEETVVTDESWNGADAPVVFAEIYDGEIYDAAKEIKDWAEADCKDGQWKPVRKLDYDFSVLTGQGSGKVSLMDEVKPKKIFRPERGKGISSVYIRGRRNHHVPSVIHIYGISLCEDRFLPG